MVEPFGHGPGGTPARLYTLGGNGGVTARVTDMGAALVGLDAAGRGGERADVVLGLDSADAYASDANPHFGGTVGRVANRVSGAAFTVAGVEYRVAANEPPNHLHGGGERALDRVQWSEVSSSADRVELAYTSPAGEEGYPGTVAFTAAYTVDGDTLEIAYRAQTDAPTPVNLTNHSYFDLAGAGAGTIADHVLRVDADRYTPVGTTTIPTGRIDPVAGTPLDLRTARRIGDGLAELDRDPASNGYDHNYVLRGGGGAPTTAAVLHDPSSGRTMEVATDQPCLQVYSGNMIADGLRGKGGAVYGRRGAVCLEPQGYPDAVNRPEFPGIILKPGDVYSHTIRFTFSVD